MEARKTLTTRSAQRRHSLVNQRDMVEASWVKKGCLYDDPQSILEPLLGVTLSLCRLISRLPNPYCALTSSDLAPPTTIQLLYLPAPYTTISIATSLPRSLYVILTIEPSPSFFHTLCRSKHNLYDILQHVYARPSTYDIACNTLISPVSYLAARITGVLTPVHFPVRHLLDFQLYRFILGYHKTPSSELRVIPPLISLNGCSSASSPSIWIYLGHAACRGQALLNLETHHNNRHNHVGHR